MNQPNYQQRPQGQGQQQPQVMGNQVSLRGFVNHLSQSNFGQKFSMPMEVGKDKQGNYRKEYVNVEVSNENAQQCRFTQGSKVWVRGRLRSQKWTDKQGQNRVSTFIQAFEIEEIAPPNPQYNQGQGQAPQTNFQGQGYAQAPAPQTNFQQPPQQQYQQAPAPQQQYQQAPAPQQQPYQQAPQQQPNQAAKQIDQAYNQQQFNDDNIPF